MSDDKNRGAPDAWHWMSSLGVASCGADYRNMKKTENVANVTCNACLRRASAGRRTADDQLIGTRIAPAETTFAPAAFPKCTVCGGTRLVKDGKLGACSYLGCKDPTHDVTAERAPASATPVSKDSEHWRRAHKFIFDRFDESENDDDVYDLVLLLDEARDLGRISASDPVVCRCICGPDDQDEWCHQHGRLDELARELEGFREQERELVSSNPSSRDAATIHDDIARAEAWCATKVGEYTNRERATKGHLRVFVVAVANLISEVRNGLRPGSARPELTELVAAARELAADSSYGCSICEANEGEGEPHKPGCSRERVDKALAAYDAADPCASPAEENEHASHHGDGHGAGGARRETGADQAAGERPPTGLAGETSVERHSPSVSLRSGELGTEGGRDLPGAVTAGDSSGPTQDDERFRLAVSRVLGLNLEHCQGAVMHPYVDLNVFRRFIDDVRRETIEACAKVCEGLMPPPDDGSDEWAERYAEALHEIATRLREGQFTRPDQEKK